MTSPLDPALIQATLQDVPGWTRDTPDMDMFEDIIGFNHPSSSRLLVQFTPKSRLHRYHTPFVGELQLRVHAPGVSWSPSSGITMATQVRFDPIGVFPWPSMNFRTRHLRHLLRTNFTPEGCAHQEHLTQVLLGSILHHEPDSQSTWFEVAPGPDRRPRLSAGTQDSLRHIDDPVFERVYRARGRYRMDGNKSDLLGTARLRLPTTAHARMQALQAYYGFQGRSVDQAARCV